MANIIVITTNVKINPPSFEIFLIFPIKKGDLDGNLTKLGQAKNTASLGACPFYKLTRWVSDL